jgi:hypothetical protein
MFKHAHGTFRSNGTFDIHTCTFHLFLRLVCCSFEPLSTTTCNLMFYNFPQQNTIYWILGWNSKSYELKTLWCYVSMWMCTICNKLTIPIEQFGCIIYNCNSMKHFNGIHLKVMKSRTFPWTTHILELSQLAFGVQR